MIMECEECGKKIREGDMVLDLDGYVYCEDCINTMSAKDVLEILDIKLKGARPNDYV